MKTSFSIRTILFFSFACLSSCIEWTLPVVENDAAADADIDADSDGDGDTDSDVDADTDVDADLESAADADTERDGDVGSGGEAIVGMAAGSRHTCAWLSSGDAYCWGANSSGQLGIGNLEEALSPTKLHGLERVDGMVAGAEHTCAWRSKGTAFCWGNDENGQLGDGEELAAKNAPVTVLGPTRAKGMAAGDSHTCLWTDTGDLFCWGWNAEGQIGAGEEAQRVHPIPQPIEVGDVVVGVSAGGLHSCAWTLEEAVLCWGSASHGQLGLGGENFDVPTELVDLPFSDGGLVAGYMHTSVWLFNRRYAEQQVYSWGLNNYYQLGDGTENTADTPTQIEMPEGFDVAGMAAGTHHTCAFTTEGDAWCWGRNDEQQVTSTNGPDPMTRPFSIPGLAGVVGMTAGYKHTCAWLEDGTARCWGDAGEGQLGNGARSRDGQFSVISFISELTAPDGGG